MMIKEIEEFKGVLLKLHPSCKVQLDPAIQKGGLHYIDIRLGKVSTEVAYKEGTFAIWSDLEEAGYGDTEPDEIFLNPENAAKRIAGLLI